jgi:hypothetical protein
MKDSYSSDVSSSLAIPNIGFEGLYLKLFGSCSWNFDVVVFVEKKRHIVKGPSLHLFATVRLQNICLLRVEVEPIY